MLFQKGQIPWNKLESNFSCRACKKIYHVKPYALRRGRGRYCSMDCYQSKFQGKNKEITCSVCQKIFKVKMSRVKRYNVKFCSMKCANIGRIYWNKGLNKNTDERVLRNGLHISETQKRVSPHGKDHWRFGKEAYHGRGAWFIKKTGEKIWLRSSWEVEFAVKLEEEGLEWRYEDTTFNLGQMTYTPDFHLLKSDLYCEVKGYFTKRFTDQMKLMRKIYPEINLQIFTKRQEIKKPLAELVRLRYNIDSSIMG